MRVGMGAAWPRVREVDAAPEDKTPGLWKRATTLVTTLRESCVYRVSSRLLKVGRLQGQSGSAVGGGASQSAKGAQMLAASASFAFLPADLRDWLAGLKLLLLNLDEVRRASEEKRGGRSVGGLSSGRAKDGGSSQVAGTACLVGQDFASLALFRMFIPVASFMLFVAIVCLYMVAAAACKRRAVGSLRKSLHLVVLPLAGRCYFALYIAVTKLPLSLLYCEARGELKVRSPRT